LHFLRYITNNKFRFFLPNHFLNNKYNLIPENFFCALCGTGKLKLNFGFNFSYFFASVLLMHDLMQFGPARTHSPVADSANLAAHQHAIWELE